MSEARSTCKACGVKIEQPSSPGRRRIYCSDHCRKQYKYAVPCSVCGVPFYNGRSGPRTCSQCVKREHEIRRQRIFEAWEAGVATEEIARREKTSPSSITVLVDKHRESLGLTMRRRSNRDLWDEIVRMRAEGLRVEEIANALGTTKENVGTMIGTMREAGVKVPRGFQGHYSPEEREAVLDAYRAGQSPGQIAKAVGMPVGTVRSMVRRARRNGEDLPYMRVPKSA